MVQWCNSEGLCSRLLSCGASLIHAKATRKAQAGTNRQKIAAGTQLATPKFTGVCLNRALFVYLLLRFYVDSMPTSPEVQNYKTPLPARDATCSNSAATRAFWPVQMVACSLQEPRNSRTQPSCKQVVFWSPTKYFSKVCTVKTPTLQFSENTNRGKVQEVDVCSELVIFYLWLESYIYIYTYYEIYYVDLLNLMLTVLLLNQGCSLGSFASIPWKRKTNLNYLQMVKKEGWPHLTRPDQMKWGERPNSFVAHVYHVLLGLPAVFV